MANLVTLEISFASGGADESAKLCWKNDEGAEQEYARVQLRARVTQETFPGHRWLLRGEQTGRVLWEGVAAARPAVQPIVVHFRERADDDEGDGEAAEGDGEAAEGDGEAATADGDGVDAAPTGVWTGADGLHRFERLPRPGRDGEVVWRQLDSAGREVARLEQLEARVDTRWLWWTDALFAQLTGMSGEREHLVWCALTIAAAYNLDAAIPWPAALRAAAARVGPLARTATLTLRRTLPPTRTRTLSRYASCHSASPSAARPTPRAETVYTFFTGGSLG